MDQRWRKARVIGGGRRPRIKAPYWACAIIKHGREKFAKKQLEARGVKVFFPRAKLSRSPILKPLFPGYLFIELENQWTHARYCPGVIDLVMERSKPLECRKSEIERLIRLQGNEGFIDLSPPEFKPQPGDLVRVHDELFKDLLATYISEAPDGCVKILFENFLGKPLEHTTSKRKIAPAL